MKKLVMKNAIINWVKRGNSSCYGNPSWFVNFDNGKEYHSGKTASNAMCAYGIGYYSVGKHYDITYHYTRNNNLIIDYIKAVQNDN